jgi:hypothetical protein
LHIDMRALSKDSNMPLQTEAFGMARSAVASDVLPLPRRRAIDTFPQAARAAAPVTAQSPASLSPAPSFSSLDFNIDAATVTVWSFMPPEERASVTPGLLADFARMQVRIRSLGSTGLDAADTRLRYCVLGSRTLGHARATPA